MNRKRTDHESIGGASREAPSGERDYFRILVESIPSVMWVTNQAGRTTYISPNVERVYGYSQQEIYQGGSSVWLDRIHPEDLPAVHEGFEAMFERDVPFNVEYRIRRKDGAWIWLHDAASSAFEQNGERFACGVFSDVTPLIRVRETVDTQDKFTKSLISSFPAYFLATDGSGKIRIMNQAMSKATGYSPDEVTGKDFMETFLREQDRANVLTVFMKSLEETIQTSMRFEILTKSGDTLQVEWHYTSIRNKGGEIDYFIGFGIDLSERLKTEAALVAKDRQFREIVENVSDIITIVEADGTMRYVTPSVERVLGYTMEERRGRNVFEHIHPDDQARAIEAFEEGAQIPGKIARIEFRARHRDGSWRILETIGKNLLDDPVLRAIVFYSRDITENRTALENQQRLESCLRQAQKMEAIGTLAGGIAHDFNNILMGITGYTELALDKLPMDSPLRDYLSEVLQAGLRAKDLVQQILTFSRESETSLKPMQILTPVKEALKLLRASLPSSIDIVQNLNTQALVLADPTQVHQLIMNLCTNAAQAIENNGTIFVTLEEVLLGKEDIEDNTELKYGPHLKLTVADSGCGMTEDVATRIFDPFFTTKEKSGGTGMGLSVVHGIVKKHGGAILFESKPNRGTAFDIYLPIVKDKAQEEALLMQSVVPRGRELVLLVDDEPFLVDLESKWLESLGYRVVSAQSSCRALDLFRERPLHFDVLVTDLTMPHMDGRELAMTVLEIRPELPIVLCTGFSGTYDEKAAKREGICAIVHKPIIKSRIAKAVRRAIDGRRTDR